MERVDADLLGGDQPLPEPPEGSSPQCAVCGHRGRSGRTLRHFTHGVSVWLCEVHGSDAFLTKRGGREFTDRIASAWTAVGALTARRIAAIRTHLRRVEKAPLQRDLPGSYSWRLLRQAAERRFAAGEDPNDVIADLRARYKDAPATVPTVRTMRRWFTDGRWLPAPLSREPRTTTPRRRPYSRKLIDASLFELLTLNSVQQLLYYMRA